MKFAFTALTVSGCVSLNSVTDNVDYTPDTQARIRLFGQHGKVTVMWRGIDCAAGNKGEKINVGGTLGDAVSSFVGTVKNHRIGIAETAMTRQLSDMDGILSKAFYKEYLLPAGKPVIVRWQTLADPYVSQLSLHPERFGVMAQMNERIERNRHKNRYECRRAWSFAFTPQAGKDYEVTGSMMPSICQLAVNEVNHDGTLVPVTLKVWPPPDKSGRQDMNRICTPDDMKIHNETTEKTVRNNQAKAGA